MSVTKNIYYHDTDAGGVVYYGRYLNFLEEARTVFLDKMGFNVKALNDQGYIFAVKTCQLSYHKPARYGDRIECTAVVQSVSPARIHFQQEVIDLNTHDLLLEANVELVSLNTSFKPVKMPENLLAVLKKESGVDD